MLASSELLTYLLDRRHLHPDSVVDGGLTLVDSSSRNHNVLVSADEDVGLFIKRGRSASVRPVSGRAEVGSIAHEASVYSLLNSLPRKRHSRAPWPDCRSYDPEHGLLILEALPNAPNLASYHRRTRRFPTTIGARLGTALADLHVHATAAAQQRPADFPSRIPWAIGIDRPGTAFYREMSFAGIELVQMLQSSEALRTALAGLRADWQADAFVHHDIKWDNCLVRTAGTSRRHTQLALVDWEFASLGDSGWDTGSAFAGYLDCWLSSIPVTGSELPDRYLELAEYPLTRMQPAMRAFWAAYVRAREWDATTADAALLRSARYAGARLLQTASERTQRSSRVSALVVCLAQLAENVLVRPEEAVEHLLGIDRGGSSRGTHDE